MGRKEKNIIARRLLHSYLSSIISIALVLLLTGIFGILAANAGAVQNYFKENVRISAILQESATEKEALQLQKSLAEIPAVKETHYISKEQGTREMEQLLGKGFLDAFDSNPIPISIELNLNAGYFHPDSIRSLSALLVKDSRIEEVVYQESLLEMLNDNLERIAYFFMVFIALLMFVSFVLINNTVRLNVYSKRFSIYTMRLVGAKRSFIRAPFLIKSLFQGILSGLLAVLALLGILFLLRNEFEQMFSIFNMELVAMVLGGVVLLGALICVVCTFFVVNRMVSLTNDELYY